MIRVYLISMACAAALVVAAFLFGQWRGYAAGEMDTVLRFERERVRLQQQVHRLGDEVSRRAQEVVRLKAEREDLATALEQEALEGDGAGRDGVGADGLRRLERRWGSR